MMRVVIFMVFLLWVSGCVETQKCPALEVYHMNWMDSTRNMTTPDDLRTWRADDKMRVTECQDVETLLSFVDGQKFSENTKKRLPNTRLVIDVFDDQEQLQNSYYADMFHIYDRFYSNISDNPDEFKDYISKMFAD